MKKAQYPASGAAPSSVVVADVNGDGKPDEIVLDECTTGNNATCVGPGVVSVMLGNGDGTFQNPRNYGSGGYLAIQVVVADLNGDGKLDLAVLNTCLDSQCEGATDVGSISILLGNGDGTFQPAKTIPAGLLSIFYRCRRPRRRWQNRSHRQLLLRCQRPRLLLRCGRRIPR